MFTAIISAVATAATIAAAIKAKQAINDIADQVSTAVPTHCILDDREA